MIDTSHIYAIDVSLRSLQRVFDSVTRVYCKIFLMQLPHDLMIWYEKLPGFEYIKNYEIKFIVSLNFTEPWQKERLYNNVFAK